MSSESSSVPTEGKVLVESGEAEGQISKNEMKRRAKAAQVAEEKAAKAAARALLVTTSSGAGGSSSGGAIAEEEILDPSKCVLNLTPPCITTHPFC